MFHWICPECGREIAPAVKECPVCYPSNASVTGPPALPTEASAISLPLADVVSTTAASAAEATPHSAPEVVEPSALEPVVPAAIEPVASPSDPISAVPAETRQQTAPETEREAILGAIRELVAESVAIEEESAPAVPNSQDLPKPEEQGVHAVLSAAIPDTTPTSVTEAAAVEEESTPSFAPPQELTKPEEPGVQAALSAAIPDTTPTSVTEAAAVEEEASAAIPHLQDPTNPEAPAVQASLAEAVSDVAPSPEPVPVVESAAVAEAPAEFASVAETGMEAAVEPTEEKTPQPVIAAEAVLNVVPEVTVSDAARPPALEPVPEHETFADRLAALAEQLRAGHIPYVRPEGSDPKVAEPPQAPLPALSPEIIPPAAKPIALLAAPPAVKLLQEPAAPALAAQVRGGQSLIPRSVDFKWTAQGLVEPELYVGSILRETPRPVSIPSPGMADLSDYPSAAARLIQPVLPSGKVLAVDTAPRVTLPGPTLPRELNSLQAAGLATIMPGQPRKSSKGLPGWVVSFLVMTILLGTAFGVIFYTLPGMLASPRPTAKEDPAVPEPPVSYPLAKNVEVTGFRFLLDNAKRPEVHYLVVNHSNALLTGMTIYVTLHAADAKPGQAPVSHFSFPAPHLGPAEFREMTSPIEPAIRATDLPNWQDLRAEVTIAQ